MSSHLQMIDQEAMGYELRKLFGEEFKVAVVGESQTGKSCIVTRYVDRFFPIAYESSKQTEVATTSLPIDGRSVKVSIFDSPGTSELRHQVGVALERAALGLLTFDVTNRSTFSVLGDWLPVMADHPYAIYVCVGNKIDRPESERQVTFEEAAAWARGAGLPYVELSAKSGENLDRVFELAIKAAYARVFKSHSETLGYIGMLDGTFEEPPKPPYLKHDITNMILTEDQLRHAFNKFDRDGNGYISNKEMKAFYRSFQNPGLEETDSEAKIDQTLKQYNMLGDGKVSYEEFCVLMLRLVQR
eukprot:TRINITY_DN66046_c2_g1_i1.p1 TRINITY_DN66046_c2_g1~~TRINITY_DN66046_c2_g1_i1.p1  ORF type:complete len:301 (-),score=13.62 TRINITY_DN66046_c2_g1_i1:172-1074(-)